MLIENKFVKYLSILITVFFTIYILYLTFNSFFIVKNQFLDIGDTTYVNQVRVDEYTKNLADFLVKDCKNNKICEVQTMLNFVTKIPYKINEGIARSSKNVVKQNYGDCDDKSNLLISLLNIRGFEAYFVLVPKHIFVIVHLKEELKKIKALYINDKRFYILESTAKNSKIGFPLKYSFSQITAIVNPFKNKQLKVNNLEYR